MKQFNETKFIPMTDLERDLLLSKVHDANDSAESALLTANPYQQAPKYNAITITVIVGLLEAAVIAGFLLGRYVVGGGR